MRPSTGNRLLLRGDYEEFQAATWLAIRSVSPSGLIAVGGSESLLLSSGSGVFDDDPFDVVQFDSFFVWMEASTPVVSGQCAYLASSDPDLGDVRDAAPSLQQLQSRYLGALCTRYPNGVFIEHRGAENSAREVLFASGFAERVRWRGSKSDPLATATLFVYRLSDYKSPPTWLNSKYWANPERFDLPPE